jgi:hypothetical protein
MMIRRSASGQDSAGKDGAEFTSPLSVVCHFWKEFDLESMRTKLDEVGLKVAEQQEVRRPTWPEVLRCNPGPAAWL